MLINVSILDKVWGIKPKGILHIGAHKAEEEEDYLHHEWALHNGIIWVDAQQDLIESMSHNKNTKNTFISALAWDKSGEKLKFNITSNSQSSSVFEFGTHSKNHPDIKVTNIIELTSSRLDDVLPKNSNFDFVNIDIQGAELKALIGLGDLIGNVDWIYSEVNKESVYLHCTLIEDLDKFLDLNGFKRVTTIWVRKAGWGDALYIRKNSTLRLQTVRKIATIFLVTYHKIKNKLGK